MPPVTVAPASRWERAGVIVNAFVAAAAVAALAVALTQAGEVRQQSAIAASALTGQTRQTDLTAVGAVSVDVDQRVDTLTVANRSTFPLLDGALWVFGTDGDETLQEVTVPVAGIPSCRSMKVSVGELLRAAGVTSGGIKRAEAQVLVQAPSGDWYLIADSGQVEAVEGSHATPIEALERSHGYTVADDTFTEAFSSDERHRIDRPITAGRAISGYSPVVAELQANGCS